MGYEHEFEFMNFCYEHIECFMYESHIEMRRYWEATGRCMGCDRRHGRYDQEAVYGF